MCLLTQDPSHLSLVHHMAHHTSGPGEGRGGGGGGGGGEETRVQISQGMRNAGEPVISRACNASAKLSQFLS